MQEFNQNGALVTLDNRKVLYDLDEMAKFQIMILPTAHGYHDADRKYSLSYLSHLEMENISNWVKAGGILVSDNFLGRNKLDGSDRITHSGKLDASNWLLSECFGVELIEKNMQNRKIVSKNNEIWQDDITTAFSRSEWTTVISKKLNDNLDVWAEWDIVNLPAITINNFGKGKSVLLANFNLIHPAQDGGFSSSPEIEMFYNKIYALALLDKRYPIQLHPRKDAYSAALAISFDDGGTDKQYARVIDFIKKNRLNSNFFVTNNISKSLLAKLSRSDNFNLELHSATHPDFRKLSYAQTCQEIQQNLTLIPDAKGFRFPFTNNSYNGLLVLEEENLLFDSSIAVNHLEFYRGSIFPYNIPIFSDGYFKSLELLEISQIFHDDWYFYQQLLTEKNYTEEQQKIDSRRFSAYLSSLWNRAILQNNGMMIMLAHPMYAGFSDETIKPLQEMLDLAKESNSWICSIDEIAEYWNNLLNLEIQVIEQNNVLDINFSSQKELHGITLKLTTQPKEVTFSGNYNIINKSGLTFLVLEKLQKQDSIRIRF